MCLCSQVGGQGGSAMGLGLSFLCMGLQEH